MQAHEAVREPGAVEFQQKPRRVEDQPIEFAHTLQVFARRRGRLGSSIGMRPSWCRALIHGDFPKASNSRRGSRFSEPVQDRFILYSVLSD
jgi:hypothetical protein